jgi:hypothetical protein
LAKNTPYRIDIRNFYRGSRLLEEYLFKNQTINRIQPRPFSGKGFAGNRWAFSNPNKPYQVAQPLFFARFCNHKYKNKVVVKN